jgi:hypothetical protein
VLVQKDWLSLLSGIVGAGIGVAYAGLWGAIIGATVTWFIPYASLRFTEHNRLKRRISKTLTLTSSKQVRDIMFEHGIFVPKDCFPYDNNMHFVKSLKKYRKAFSELETEHKIVRDLRGSVEHGYVDPPNQWVNDWSGRAFLILSDT